MTKTGWRSNAMHTQMYMLEGGSRWNLNRARAAVDVSGASHTRMYDVRLMSSLNVLSNRVLRSALLPQFNPPGRPTGSSSTSPISCLMAVPYASSPISCLILVHAGSSSTRPISCLMAVPYASSPISCLILVHAGSLPPDPPLASSSYTQGLLPPAPSLASSSQLLPTTPTIAEWKKTLEKQ
ncbi:hypothetical protein PBY51_014315 [Eleginops maclovinus]|uniref:Uncharacterized protein n=1 Tax=Eleginops maclovinus TaxID=56733 RepID=A0AAN7WX54_ELEMC|nr:hypothetical protein PBY51_014315 [Eleginops maclovinus]